MGCEPVTNKFECFYSRDYFSFSFDFCIPVVTLLKETELYFVLPFQFV